jgi:hypothetical protein
LNSLSLLLAASLCKLSERIEILLAVRVSRKNFGGILRRPFIRLNQPPSNFLRGMKNPVTRCQAYAGYL